MPATVSCRCKQRGRRETTLETILGVSTFQCARMTRGVSEYANDSINRGVLIEPAGDMRPKRIAQRYGHCDGSVVLYTHQESKTALCSSGNSEGHRHRPCCAV